MGKRSNAFYHPTRLRSIERPFVSFVIPRTQKTLFRTLSYLPSSISHSSRVALRSPLGLPGSSLTRRESSCDDGPVTKSFRSIKLTRTRISSYWNNSLIPDLAQKNSANKRRDRKSVV